MWGFGCRWGLRWGSVGPGGCWDFLGNDLGNKSGGEQQEQVQMASSPT